ncbi:hypothetical protein K439DRAFT_1665239 [Ramaria rubella]|nr:hypothetical protein K439DRAFT_1665239 [Ramaria rubella]
MDHHDDQPMDNADGHDIYQTETYVFTGNGGPALLATMQDLMNRMMRGHQQEEHPQSEQPEQPEQPDQPEQPEQREQPQNNDVEMPSADDPPLPDLPTTDSTNPSGSSDDGVPPLEPTPSDDPPASARPIRPLPRPHAHFHAHTPAGIIDLFTFNISGTPPPPPPGTATFTLNIGADLLAGFESFFLGNMQKEREPDPERAKVLLRGMEVVPQGLVRRLERAGGVPGGQGSEDTAGCAVCWGPLLDEVEPGEWDTAKEKDDKAKDATESAHHEEHEHNDEDEFRGRIVALPCAHVYHAECLLPWFSRNTTCPTCRFDIDPESLTWMPRPPPPPPTHDVPPENEPAVDEQAPGTPHPEQPQRANPAEVARLNAFLSTFLRTLPFAHGQPDPATEPNQHQPEPQPEAQPQPQQQSPTHPQQQQQPQPQPQPHPQPEPQPQLATAHIIVPPIGAALPGPPVFRLPMFVLPQFGPPPLNVAAPQPAGPPPAFNAPHAPPPPFFVPQGAPPVFHAPHAPPQHPPRRERKKWTAPEPVGKSLRQRVEEKERELGLRCDDMVCDVAPSDEDPVPECGGRGVRRIKIRAAYDGCGRACEHVFHPACLVTSARVAGVRGEGDGEDAVVQGGEAEAELQVSCPVCRAVGSLNRGEWDEGVRASEAEMV